MIVVRKVYIIVRIGELTISKEKCTVARYRLVEKLHRFKIIFSLPRWVNETFVEKFFCFQVEIVSGYVRRGTLADSILLRWR